MTRVYTGSTANYLSSVVTPSVGAHPLSFDGWINPGSDIATEQTLVGISNTATLNGTGWWAEILSGGIIAITGVLENYNFASASGLKAQQWNHFACVFASTTSRLAYTNGVAGTAETTSKVLGGVDTTTIGAFRARISGTPAVANALTGRVCEVRVWNTALTAQQVMQLARGGDPRTIPGLQNHYCPITEIAKQTNAWDYGKSGIVLPMIGAVGAVDDMPPALRRPRIPWLWDANAAAVAARRFLLVR